MLVPLERVLAGLWTATRPLEPRQLPIEATAGRVLAAPLRSPASIPAHALALRDGWAVVAADVVGASSYSPVVLAAEAAWVAAGQALPAGADAVLPPDVVIMRNGLSEIVAEAAPGEGIRRVGEDAASGAILRDVGERMRPSDIAVALAAGVGRVLVREARVRILSLSRPAARDAGAELVARLSEAAGAAVDRVGLPSPDAPAIAAALREPGPDLIVIVGTGLDPNHPASEALAASGSLIAHGVALRPGETSGCGVVSAVPVILAPARLEGALAVTLMLVLPCLDHLTGASARPPSLSGPLTRKVASAVGMTDIVLLRRRDEGLEPLAVGDLTLAAIGGADGWLVVTPDSEGFAAGETVAAFLL